MKVGNICTNCVPLWCSHCINNKRSWTTSVTNNTTTINNKTTNVLPNLLASSTPPHANHITQSAANPSLTFSDNHQHDSGPVMITSAYPTNPSDSSVSQPLQPSPLPPFNQIFNPSFIWGNQDSAFMLKSLEDAYSEVVHWQNNTFTVPFGKAGKELVFELSRLLRAYADGSALESIALTDSTVLSVLLLQKPFYCSKQKDHSACLERHLLSWKKGDIAEMLWEGHSIQSRLTKSVGRNTVKKLSMLLLKADVPRQSQCHHSATSPTW